MAYDGITTMAMAVELRNKILLGKIEKVYQPEADELVFNIHTRDGNLKLYASCNSSNCRIHFIEKKPLNPPNPLSFCMLMRKHLQGARIVDVSQKDSERIIEITMETLNELGFSVSKKLIFEIMGRHSNIILVDMNTGKIIDSIKRISIDVNRVRQILPGKTYEYPPKQDKTPFKEILPEDLDSISSEPKNLLSHVGGISPVFANQLSHFDEKYSYLHGVISSIQSNQNRPVVYTDKDGIPKEFYTVPLIDFEESFTANYFGTLSKCIDFYYEHRSSSNRAKQKSSDLLRSVTVALDKAYLKKQRLNEDMEKAKNSDNFRLYGELLTANIHLVKAGAKSVNLTNYYDGNTITVPLQEKYSAAKNAQLYFKKYGKAKTAIKEKQIQLEDTEKDISYLESVVTFLENAKEVEQVEAIRNELIETGYVKRRKTNIKEKKYKANPYHYTLPNGMEVFVGRNNRENDILTTKTAEKHDIWFHTKDIPGSHVILKTGGLSLEKLDPDTIYTVASLAAFHSKGKASENVPVDYLLAKHVKKPAGAKPGMVIFTNNKTVWVNPKDISN